MKKNLRFLSLFLILILGIKNSVAAQTFAYIGNGTTSNTSSSNLTPFANSNWGARHQYLIKAAELTASGIIPNTNIDAIAFNVSNANGVTSLQNWNVKVYTTTLSDPLSIDWVTTNMVAYSFPSTLNLSLGWNETQLAGYFTWNGTDNLVVETCFNNGSITTNASTVRTTALNGATFARIFRGNTSAICSGTGLTSTSTNTRPNMRLFYNSTVCSGTPNAGNASISSPINPVGTNVLLTLTGNNFAPGAFVQWEEATNINGPWTAMPGATNFSWSYPTYFSRFYRASVSCGFNTAYSNILQSTVPNYLATGTYTINNALPTGGSNFNNFAAFDSAIVLPLTGPVTVNVVQNNYSERLILSKIKTTAFSTLTINGNGATLSYVSNNSINRGVIVIDSSNYVTINNLNVNAWSVSSGNYAWGVYIKNHSSYDSISGCNIYLDSNGYSNHYAGIVIAGSDSNFESDSSFCNYITISNNYVSGGYYGISLRGPLSNATVNNNKIVNSYLRGITISNSNWTWVSNNEIHRKGRTAFLTDFTGIYFNASTRVQVFGNRIHDPAYTNPSANFTYSAVKFYKSPGIHNNGPRTYVYNNVVYNANGTGDHFYFYNDSSDAVDYFNNSISTGVSNITATGATASLYLNNYPTVATVTFINNDVSIIRNATVPLVFYYVVSQGDKIQAGSNNFYMQGTGKKFVANWYGNYTTTWDDFMSETNYNVWTDYEIAPYYQNDSAGILIPTNKYLNNLGSHTGYDINGVARSTTTPDIGAFEFTPDTCINQNVGGTAFVFDSLACSGGDVQLFLKDVLLGNGVNISWESSPLSMNSWTSYTTQSVKNTNFHGVMPSVPTSFRAVLNCNGNIVYSIPKNVGIKPFYRCYCNPSTYDTLYDFTSNFNDIFNISIVGTTLNSHSDVTGMGSYDFKDPSAPDNTATLYQGLSYVVSFSSQSSSPYGAFWIDYDHNGIFDNSEFTPMYNSSGNQINGVINFPTGALSGTTGMRVRTMGASYYYPPNTVYACKNISSFSGGEAEDYVINLVTCPQPTVTITTPATTFCIGTPVTFKLNSSTNAGSNPTYQWKLNNIIIPGAISDSLSLSNFNYGDVVTLSLTGNCYISVSSNGITLTQPITNLPTVSISASTTNFCPGTPTNFSSSATNSGISPTYNWKLNNVNILGATSNTLTISNFNYGDIVSLSFYGYCSILAASNNISLVQSTNYLPTVSINSSVNNICYGTPVSFYSTATNAGTNPSYQWQKNGIIIQGATNSTYTSNSINNNDFVLVNMINNCGLQAYSNLDTIHVSSNAPPIIIISSSTNNVCYGTPISFISFINPGGISSNFKWYLNGNIIPGATGTTYSSSTINDLDTISFSMVSNNICFNNYLSISNKILMHISYPPIPNVTIAVGSTNICSGATISFTATNTTLGTFTYQWKKNGQNIAGATALSYTSSNINDGDVFTISATNSCGNNTLSNAINIHVTQVQTPSVSISTSLNNFCQGTNVSIGSNISNGGTNPSYQWYLNNGIIAGETNPTFNSSALNNGDSIKVKLISNLSCATTSTVFSNNIGFTVNSIINPAVSIVADTMICNGDSVLLTSSTSNVPLNATYQWYKNGNTINGATNLTYFENNISDGDDFSLNIFTSAPCVISNNIYSNHRVIHISYPTAQISPSGNFVICSATSLMLNANSGSAYLWSNGANTPSITISNSGLIMLQSPMWMVAMPFHCL